MAKTVQVFKPSDFDLSSVSDAEIYRTTQREARKAGREAEFRAYVKFWGLEQLAKKAKEEITK